MSHWDRLERRNGTRERRDIRERRVPSERRFDYRDTDASVKRSFKSWLRSLSNNRMGVDRRKGGDRRMDNDRRSHKLRSILTPEELSDLLEK